MKKFVGAYIGVAAIALLAFAGVGAAPASAQKCESVLSGMYATQSDCEGDLNLKALDEGTWEEECVELLNAAFARFATLEACEAGTEGAGKWEDGLDIGIFLENGVPIIELLPLLELSTTGEFVLHAEPLGIATEILCEKATVLAPESMIEELGMSFAKIAYTVCVVDKPAGCKVKTPIEVTLEDQLLWILPSGPLVDYFAPLEGQPFAPITLEGCLAAGTYNVTGSDECKLPKGEEELTLHEIECLASGSKLSLGGLPATYAGTTDIELESGGKFSGKQN